MKIGMLFPGYGSQFVGMGKELYNHSRVVQEYFEEASNCLDRNFVKLCFASSDAELSKLTNAYPALFLVSVATAAACKEAGIELDLVAGHGLGEYSALCTAKGLSFPDGLYLLNKLSQFYLELREQLDVKAVMVDGLSARKLKQICKENSSAEAEAQIAIYENKTEHIVTGHTEAVNAVAETASDAGADKVKTVQVEEGFHTPILTDLVNQLKMYLTKVDFKDVNISLITNVDAKPVHNAKQVQNAVMRQIVEPLYWHDVLKQFAHIDLILVPAPSKLLLNELSAYYPEKKIMAIQQLSDIDEIKKYIAEHKPVLVPEQVEQVAQLQEV